MTSSTHSEAHTRLQLTDRVRQGLSQGWREEDLGVCEQRAGRIVQIMRVLVHQFDVLETMQPQGFQDFSKYSLQFAREVSISHTK